MTNSKELVSTIVKAMEDKKAMDVTVLDLQNVSLMADYFVICHGNSDVQVKAIATEVKDKAEGFGAVIKGIEGFHAGRWILIDLNDVIVHVFHREDRAYYHLERLWSDASIVETI